MTDRNFNWIDIKNLLLFLLKFVLKYDLKHMSKASGSPNALSFLMVKASDQFLASKSVWFCIKF